MDSGILALVPMPFRMINQARNLLTKHPRTEWLIPAALSCCCCCGSLQRAAGCARPAPSTLPVSAVSSTWRLNAATTRLAASIRRWQRYWWRPLYCGVILLLTAPGGRLGPMERDQATGWLYSQENWWHLLMEARVVSALFAVVLCLGVWITARRMFGLAVAVVSTTVLAFEPNILGHGALLLNNVLLAALFLFAGVQFLSLDPAALCAATGGHGIVCGAGPADETLGGGVDWRADPAGWHVRGVAGGVRLEESSGPDVAEFDRSGCDWRHRRRNDLVRLWSALLGRNAGKWGAACLDKVRRRCANRGGLPRRPSFSVGLYWGPDRSARHAYVWGSLHGCAWPTLYGSSLVLLTPNHDD